MALVRLAQLAGIALLFFHGGTVHAQQPALSWAAPASCPSEQVWLSAVQARVDGASWRDIAPRLRASVQITMTQTGYALMLATELDGVTGQRQLQAPLCSELVEAAALIVALAIDPNAALPAVIAPLPSVEPAPVLPAPVLQTEPAPSAEKPALPPKPAPPPRPEAQPEAVAAQGKPSAPRLFFVRVLAQLDTGPLPKVALSPVLQAGVRLRKTTLELGFSYSPTQSVPVEDRDDASAGVLRFLAGSVGACHGLLGRRVELAPCARVEYGRIWGRGRNLDGETLSGGAPWLALIAGVQVSVLIVDAFAFELDLSGGVPVLPAAFTVGGLGEVHATPDVVGRLGAGAELRF